MNIIHTKATVSFQATLVLDESAARALDAMAGYGVDAFLEVFYAKLGKHYMQPHAAGLRSLLEKIKAEIPSQLHAIDRARAAIDEVRP